MKILKSNNITCFDVDKTLISDISGIPYAQGSRTLEYGEEQVGFHANKKHVRFLKHCKKRGDFIVVWSQNGFSWAESVVKNLELQNYVDIVMSKPLRYVDDKEDPKDIIGNRVYLGE